MIWISSGCGDDWSSSLGTTTIGSSPTSTPPGVSSLISVMGLYLVFAAGLVVAVVLSLCFLSPAALDDTPLAGARVRLFDLLPLSIESLPFACFLRLSLSLNIDFIWMLI